MNSGDGLVAAVPCGVLELQRFKMGVTLEMVGLVVFQLNFSYGAFV